MKIYRLPKSKAEDFEVYNTPMSKGTTAEQGQYKSNVDLSQNDEPCHSAKCIKVDISDERSERKSVIAIVLEESDIIALHQGLIRGLQEKRDSWEEAKQNEMIKNTSAIFQK